LKKIIAYGSTSFIDTVKIQNKDSQVISFTEPSAFYNAIYAFDNQDIHIMIDQNSIVKSKGPFSFLGFNKNKLLQSEIETHPILSKIGNNKEPEQTPPIKEELLDEGLLEEPIEEIVEEPVEETVDEDFDLEALIAGGFNDEPEP